jgi:L-lysine 2,3-aminomutase
MAMYENGERLDLEIERLQEKLKNLEPTTKEYSAINNQLKVMYDLRIAQYKEELSINERADKSEKELNLREKELAERAKEHEDDLAQKKKDRIHSWAHTGIDIALTIIKSGCTLLGIVAMTREGYAFEETGRPVSTTFREVRGLLTSLIKKK